MDDGNGLEIKIVTHLHYEIKQKKPTSPSIIAKAAAAAQKSDKGAINK